MDQLMWTAVFCITLSFLSGACSVKLLLGGENQPIYLYDTETQESKGIKNNTFVTSLDYHFSKGYIYYTGYSVNRISIDSNINVMKVIEDGPRVDGISVDWISNYIYWARSDNVELAKADLDGENKKSIITKRILDQVDGLSNINHLYNIEVDPYERILFIIAGNDNPWLNGKLVKSDLEGRNLIVITHEKYKIITTFTISRPQKTLYVVKGAHDSIYSCKYNGEVIEEFSICPKILGIYSFAIYRQNMYMAYTFDENGETTFHVEPLGSVKCPRESIKQYVGISDIKVYDIDVQQPLNVYNSYQRIKERFCNWDKCSLLSTEWERIKCLEWDCSLTTVNKKNASSVELLIGRSNGIIQYHDTETQKTKVIVNDSVVRSLDYHYSEGYVYYSGDSIKRRSFDPNINDLKEISKDRNVYGIAVDWINNNLYWTRTYHTEVVKADLDGKNQTSIITKNIFDPLKGLYHINYMYNIEVDPYERTLFMIAGSERLYFIGTLVKSDLEGRNLFVYKRKNDKLISTFTIDRHQKILYIVNIGHQGIYSCRYNGEDIEEFSVCPKMWWIYPFATFQQNMYMAYGYEESSRNNIFYVGHLASVKCPLHSFTSDNTILGIKVYGIDVQQPLNVYNSYRPIKQRFSNWNKCSLLTTEWERLDCLEMASFKTIESKRSRYISYDDKRQH